VCARVDFVPNWQKINSLGAYRLTIEFEQTDKTLKIDCFEKIKEFQNESRFVVV